MARQRSAEVELYEGLRTRAHWKPSDAARVLAEWRQSGESMTAFAARHRLGLHRLHYWRERLTTKPAATEPLGVRLVPAVVRPAPLLSLERGMTGAPVCVVADGVRVELSDPHGTDPQWVAALVRGLRRGHA